MTGTNHGSATIEHFLARSIDSQKKQDKTLQEASFYEICKRLIHVYLFLKQTIISHKYAIT